MRPLRIGIIGTRGIPNRYGGFERFVELLVAHPGWAGGPFRFEVFGESPEAPFNAWTDLREVGLTKTARPLSYFHRSAYLAAQSCEVTLCCSVGISVFSLWQRLKGRTLIVNPDGCEWLRTKWNPLQRLALRSMYAPAMGAAHHLVVDAEALRTEFPLRHETKSRYIPYQAPEPMAFALEPTTRQTFALQRPYLLAVARLEPENNLELLLDAFEPFHGEGFELLIVGPKTTPHFTSRLARREGGPVRFLGPLFDQIVLNQLRSNCVAYIHGHSVGGTNPSLLEALATVQGHLYCHDNKYNREVAGAHADYFTNTEQLRDHFRSQLDAWLHLSRPAHRVPTRDARFHPDVVFQRYLELFEEIRVQRGQA